MLDELTLETIRLYLLRLSELRNGGGQHASYPAINAFLVQFWDEYDLPTHNPIFKVAPPKLSRDVRTGVLVADIQAMVEAGWAIN